MRQVSVAEMNESELLMTCRKEPSDDVENVRCKPHVRSSADIWLLAERHPAYRQHERKHRLLYGTWEPVDPMLRERRGAEALRALEYQWGSQGQMVS